MRTHPRSKHKRRVRFSLHRIPRSDSTDLSSVKPNETLQTKDLQTDVMSTERVGHAKMPNSEPDVDSIPSYLLGPPLLQNPLTTRTSILQAATIDECLPLLDGLNNPRLRDFSPFDYNSNGLLALQTESHITFLHDALSEYPGGFVGLDASRPWMVYWALLALHFLGQDVSEFRSQVVKTFLPLQNVTGGYGGGQGHSSHLAGTYAALLSLALVGDRIAWSLTDRKKMWLWLGRLKQANGGFRICEGGEEDVRGAYCAMVALSLLNLPWELPDDAPARAAGLTTFGDGLGEYLSRCQTYEGGISAAPGNEAHGAYAFCALACLCLLDRADRSMNRYLDMDALLSWLSSRQYAPEGGFAGRTNKVADGCYSHWLGGCWPLILAASNGPEGSTSGAEYKNLYSTEGLVRFILNCCQNPDGGLRDKPSKRPDAYHTCYTLAGVSTTEHYHYFINSVDEGQFVSAFAWRVVRNGDRHQEGRDSEGSGGEFDADCRLNAVHPVFVIPHNAAMNMRAWAMQQPHIC